MTEYTSEMRRRKARAAKGEKEATGTVATVKYPCAYCKGTGRDRFGVMSELSTCQVCGGRGEVALHPPVQPCKFCGGSGVEPYSSNRLTCSACGGKGMVKAIPDGVPCPKCEGSGIDPHTRTIAMACAKCHGQGVIRPTLHTEEIGARDA